MAQVHEYWEGDHADGLRIARDAGFLVTQEALGWVPQPPDSGDGGGEGAKLIRPDLPPYLGSVALEQPEFATV